MAPGTVMLISTIGIPARETASAANRASSAVDTRTAGMMPISSMRARTSSFFIVWNSLVNAPGQTLTRFYTKTALGDLIDKNNELNFEEFLRRRPLVSIGSDPHVQGRQKKNAHRQGTDQTSHDYNRKRPLRIRT